MRRHPARINPLPSRRRRPPGILALCIGVCFLLGASAAFALKPEDLVGLWSGKTLVGRVPRQREVQILIDVWPAKDGLAGFYVSNSIIYELRAIKLEGKIWSFETSNPVSGDAAIRVSGEAIQIEGSGDRLYRSEMKGGEGQEGRYKVDFLWRPHPPAEPVLSDADLSGVYEGKLGGTPLGAAQSGKLRVRIELQAEGEKASGRVIVSAEKAGSEPVSHEIRSMRRQQNRLYLSWSPNPETPGAFLGAISQDSLQGDFMSNRGFGQAVFKKSVDP